MFIQILMSFTLFQGLADLNVASVVNVDTVDPGQTVNATVDIHNSGGRSALNFTVALFMTPSQSCSELTPVSDGFYQVSRVGAGSTLVLPVTFNAPTEWATFYLVARVDFFNQVEESDESNNCGLGPQTSVNLPDLLITEQSMIGNRLVPGQTHVTYSARVGNQVFADGKAAPSTMRYYLLPENQGPDEAYFLQVETPTPALVGGTSVNLNQEIQVAADMALGNYTFHGLVDGYDDVAEADEANNLGLGIDVELVDKCTLADVTGDDAITIQDLITLVNEGAALLSPTNQHLNLARSPAPFPEVIDRQDLLELLDCWSGSRDALDGGVLQDFHIQFVNNAYQLEVQAQGDIAAISVLAKLPPPFDFQNVEVYDALGSGYQQELAQASGSYLLVNQFNSTQDDWVTMNGQFPFASLEVDSSLDLSQLEVLPPGSQLRAGFAVKLTFANGSEQVLVKRLRYASFADQTFRDSISNALGQPIGLPIHLDSVEATTSLTLNGLGLEDASDLLEFVNLKVIKMNDNNLTELPDLRSLTQLQVIKVRRNQLKTIGPLPDSVSRLIVDENRLSGLPYLNHLSGLTELKIRDNQLTALPDLDQTQLLDLFANNNQIRELGTLPPLLDNLDLANNQLRGALQLGPCPLFSLRLTNNYLTCVDSLLNRQWASNPWINLANNDLDQGDSATIEALDAQFSPGLNYRQQRHYRFPDWDLVAWWPFEGDGDDLGQNNHLTIGNASFADGHQGQSLSLNGSGNGMPVNLLPQNLPMGSTPRTYVGMIFLPQTQSGRQALLDIGYEYGSSDHHLSLFIENGYIGLKSAGIDYLTTQTAIYPGYWRQWAVTYDGAGEWRFYVNTTLVGTVTAPVNTLAGPLRLGHSAKHVMMPLEAELDDVKIFSRALSSQELNALLFGQL